MADPETIYHWRRLDDRITTSGQPTEEHLADIHALGVRHVVNLAGFQNPTDEDFEQFCSIMEHLKDVPVHVHCIANYRVSAFLYRCRRDMLGMDKTQACAEMEAIWHPEGAWADFVDG
jgi:protein tyrosine phosphatase (PTP) superfamily phosphohydrolase (DUF442 family)